MELELMSYRELCELRDTARVHWLEAMLDHFGVGMNSAPSHQWPARAIAAHHQLRLAEGMMQVWAQRSRQ